MLTDPYIKEREKQFGTFKYTVWIVDKLSNRKHIFLIWNKNAIQFNEKLKSISSV